MVAINRCGERKNHTWGKITISVKIPRSDIFIVPDPCALFGLRCVWANLRSWKPSLVPSCVLTMMLIWEIAEIRVRPILMSTYWNIIEVNLSALSRKECLQDTSTASTGPKKGIDLSSGLKAGRSTVPHRKWETSIQRLLPTNRHTEMKPKLVFLFGWSAGFVRSWTDDPRVRSSSTRMTGLRTAMKIKTRTNPWRPDSQNRHLQEGVHKQWKSHLRVSRFINSFPNLITLKTCLLKRFGPAILPNDFFLDKSDSYFGNPWSK